MTTFIFYINVDNILTNVNLTECFYLFILFFSKPTSITPRDIIDVTFRLKCQAIDPLVCYYNRENSGYAKACAALIH